MADFYAARSEPTPPLPWQTFAPPFPGELVERDRTVALVFRLARQERDAWVTWPARVAALMAADLTAALSGAGEITIGTGAMQQILEAHVRAHLAELAATVLDVKMLA